MKKRKKVELPPMSEEEQLELQILLESEEKEKRENKIRSYFPDTGPVRRSLYVKHMEFFVAGGKHIVQTNCPKDCDGSPHAERCFCAANRVGKCLTYNSGVETAEGRRTVGELYEEGKCFEVWAWDGSKQVKALASAPFRKAGLHTCYRITFQDGTWIECADHHRILTSEGWRLTSECFSAISSSPQESNSEPFLSESLQDAPRYSNRVSNSECDSQDGSCHPCDEQPLRVGETFRAIFPLLNAIRERIRLSLRRDGGGSKRSNTFFPCYETLRYKNRALLDYLVQSFYRSTSNGIGVSNALPLCLSNLASLQFAGDLCPSLPFCEPLVLDEYISENACIHQSAFLSPFLLDPTNPIVAVNRVEGKKEVFDFTVEKYHNYIAANMVHHNTESVGAYEMTCHLTGEYPVWWKGKRFSHPISAWAAGDTSQTTRDIIQLKLLGELGTYGTGMIPKRLLIHTTTKGGLPGAVETIYVKHSSGGRSELGLKSFDQGRLAFQGTSKHVVWLDEECKRDIYIECLLRTMKTTTFTGGIIMLTFTPLQGMSPVVRDFMGVSDLDDSSSLGQDVPEVPPEMAVSDEL